MAAAALSQGAFGKMTVDFGLSETVHAEAESADWCKKLTGKLQLGAGQVTKKRREPGKLSGSWAEAAQGYG